MALQNLLLATGMAGDTLADRHIRADRDPVRRARIFGATEWKGKVARSYQRRTRAADALIASAYLGTNTSRVRRAPAAPFLGAVGEVSRVWQTPIPSLTSQSSGDRRWRGRAR